MIDDERSAEARAVADVLLHNDAGGPTAAAVGINASTLRRHSCDHHM
jgi:hypothetical protein